MHVSRPDPPGRRPATAGPFLFLAARTRPRAPRTASVLLLAAGLDASGWAESDMLDYRRAAERRIQELSGIPSPAQLGRGLRQMLRTSRRTRSGRASAGTARAS